MKIFRFMQHLPAVIGNREIYTRTFVSLLLANMFFWMSVNFFLPVLPIYYHSLGMDDHQVGLAIGIFSLGAIVFRVIGGKAVDKYGSAPVITAGIVLSIGAIASYYFTTSLLAASISRLLHGIGISGYSAAALTMATLMHEEKNTVEAVAVYTLFTMIGVGIAASMAGWLYNVSGFGLVVAVGAAATLLSLVFFPKTPRLKIKTRDSQPLPLGEVITEPGVYVPTVSLLAVNLCYAAVMTFLPLFMVSSGVTEFSLFYIAYSISVVASRIWVGRLCTVLSPERLAFHILIIMGASMFVTSLGGYWWVLAVAGASIGIGYGLAFPTLATIITSTVQPANRGTAFGFFSMAVDGGVALGAIGLGAVSAELGYRSAFIAAGGYTVIYSIAYFFWLVPKIRQRKVRSKVCQ
ncbi:putative MFS family arabinose efflux permease [Anaerospora hongkongensis]|uniref:Putative MFS family arabinose efflux permease n=1 Tax=Anaerospora hongkongensis TaxID=244830 RepID=A0A4R1PQW7_9FIRM|nr:MFS transporter [Anaerospora hongkongensis]TCL33968.1 putative MFS family arabinose efflux permease [Anaerospora hongkongensis]